MFLQENDWVALVSPAGFLPDDTVVKHAVKLLKKWHLRAYVAPHALERYGHFAGTDTQRLSDLQEVFDNPEIKMIWALRGGYGSIRIVDKLDFTHFNKQPKLLVGFSDITILHNKIQLQNHYGLHAFMPVQLKDKISKEVVKQTKRAIRGNEILYRFKKSAYNTDFKQVEGVVTGGNLANLYSVLGTNLDIDTQQKILFIEDVGEQLYQIDRMMIALKKAGKFNKLKALLVGQFTDIPDNKPSFAKSYQQIILEHTRKFDFPVIFDAPIGHITNNYPLMLGHQLLLKDENNRILLRQPALKV